MPPSSLRQSHTAPAKGRHDILPDRSDPVLCCRLEAGGDGHDHISIRIDVNDIAAVAYRRAAVLLLKDPPQVPLGEVLLCPPAVPGRALAHPLLGHDAPSVVNAAADHLDP